MAEIPNTLTAVERLRQLVDAMVDNNRQKAQAAAALAEFAKLAEAEEARHPRMDPAEREMERQDVGRRLAVFRQTNSTGSPLAWIVERTGYPAGRVKGYLRELREVRADFPNSGQAAPMSPGEQP